LADEKLSIKQESNSPEKDGQLSTSSNGSHPLGAVGPWTRRFDVGDATPRFDFASVVVRKLNRRHGFGMPSLAGARQVSGAASLAHSAGADLKTVQEQLGHTSIVLTADTYTSVLADEQHKTAEAAARLVLTAARGPSRRKPATTDHRRSPLLSRLRRGRNPCDPGQPNAGRRETGVAPTGAQATPTVHIRQSRAMNAQLNERTARASNPEPAD